MLIKEHPEDFCVEESISLPWSAEPGAFRLYRLEKRSWNTVDALRTAAEATNVPGQVIRYGGKKDRHAHTVQYCTTPVPFDLSYQRHNVKVTCVGFSETPMTPRDIVGNRFHIVLRRVEKAREDFLGMCWEDAVRHGTLNYFDDQRFGGVNASGVFLAEFLVRKDFSGALRCHMTACHPDASPSLRRRKQSLERLWGDWRAMRPLCVSPEEREMVNCCLEKPGEEGIKHALRHITRETWGLYLSSFQSALWNEALSSLVQQQRVDIWPLQGKSAPLWFFRHKGPERAWTDLQIPVPSGELRREDGEGALALLKILEGRHLQPSDFHRERLPQGHFAAFSRPAAVRPRETSLAFADDDRHPGFRKGLFSFLLPGGSYATLLMQTLICFPGACANGERKL